MLTFQDMAKIKPPGFHGHHVIPVEICKMQSLAIIIGKAKFAGFDENDFERNGMLLPSNERNAVAFRLPMHRGSHCGYNRLVAERVSGFGGLPPNKVFQQISLLQTALKSGLRAAGANLHIDREPLRANVDFSKMDDAIDRLYAVTEPDQLRFAREGC